MAEWEAKLAQRLANTQPTAGPGAATGAGASAAAEDQMSIGSTLRTTMRVRYRPVGGGGGSSEAGALTFPRTRGEGSRAAAGVVVEVGHRSMRTYYRQRFRPSNSALGSANPELYALMLSYANAGVLSTIPQGPRAPGAGVKHERSRAQMTRDSKQHMQQGINNNMTMNGMKHFKNQSLQCALPPGRPPRAPVSPPRRPLPRGALAAPSPSPPRAPAYHTRPPLLRWRRF